MKKILFNKIMMVNPVSLSSLKQMPGKKENFSAESGNSGVWNIGLSQAVVSRDAVDNEFIENYAFDPFHPDIRRMHIMRQRTEAVMHEWLCK